MVWGTIIACYLFLAGLSAGSFASSFYLEYLHPEKHSSRKLSRILALICVCLGLFLLILDAPGSHHNPVSLFYLLCGMRSSVMSWGVVILILASGLEFFYVIYEFLREKDTAYTHAFTKVKHILAPLGLLSALGLAIYTGLLIGVVKTVPLWNNALLPVLFLISALSAGMALSQLASALAYPKELGGLERFNLIHLVLLISELIFVGIMLYIVQSGNAAGAQSVQLLTSGSLALYFWGSLIFLGMVFPIIIELISLRRERKVGTHQPQRALRICLELAVLIGGFFLRYLIIKAAVPIDFLGF